MDDEDLKRAIALSLQDTQRSPLVNRHVDLDSDGEYEEEDEDDARFHADLQKAIRASQVEPTIETSSGKTTTYEPASSANVFLSERAQLEKERVARLKRLRGDSEVSPSGSDDAKPRKRQHIFPFSNASVRTNGNSTGSATSITPSSSNNPRASTSTPTIDQTYWEGEMRQTACQYAEPRGDKKPTFRLTEILGKKTEIQFAILSSYSLSLPWIYQFFDPATPVIIVAQPDESGAESIKYIFPNWIRTTPFLRNGRGCMHMKFMLLFYKTGRLRVVISTANLVDFDWRDIENTVWVQDVPPRPRPIAHDPKEKEDFPAVMQQALKALNVSPALDSLLTHDHPTIPLRSISALRTHYDFSKVSAHLVTSLAGKHEGWPKVILTGHPRLMKVVRAMACRPGRGSDKELFIECQGSSIGTYSTQWMNEFYHSAKGESGEDWLDEPKSRRAKLAWPRGVCIVFPSARTVKESALGEPGGGTIFCRQSQWDASKFPREMFHDSNSRAGRVLMHSKMIIATFRDRPQTSKGKAKGKRDSDTETDDSDVEIIDPSLPAGWAYVGSHNFTPSAWGNLSGSSFNPSLNIVNYEMGIVFPLKDEQAIGKVACFQRPPRKYVPGEDRPWIQEESAYFR